MSIKVSIIIPIYNVECYIERCLLSVFNQTYSDIEILLVNDSTPDNSMEVVHNVINSHSRNYNIQILEHDCNKGLSAARNTGTKLAHGEYIYFLDSDDAITPDCIAKLVDLAMIYKPDFVIGGIKSFGSDTFIDHDLSILPIYVSADFNQLSSLYFDDKWYEMACNKLIEKQFILDNSLFFYDGILHEDTLWSFLLALSAKSMCVCPESTYLYYIRSNSITGKVTEKTFRSKVIIVDKFISAITEKNEFELSKFVLKNLYCILIFFVKYGDKAYISLLENRVKSVRKHLLLNSIFHFHFKSIVRSLIMYSPKSFLRFYFKNK